MKLITTIKTHNILLEKFFEYGADDNIIMNAINSNWKSFYPIKTNNYKASSNIVDTDEWSDGAIRCDPNEYR